MTFSEPSGARSARLWVSGLRPAFRIPAAVFENFASVLIDYRSARGRCLEEQGTPLLPAIEPCDLYWNAAPGPVANVDRALG